MQKKAKKIEKNCEAKKIVENLHPNAAGIRTGS